MFVAQSERASVAEVAGILSVEVPKLQMTTSIACRLGFGTRLPSPAQPLKPIALLQASADVLHATCLSAWVQLFDGFCCCLHDCSPSAYCLTLQSTCNDTGTDGCLQQACFAKLNVNFEAYAYLQSPALAV